MQVLACALLLHLGEARDGVVCGEIAAFCVDPGFRGSGRGDSLLDYVEQVCSCAFTLELPFAGAALLQLIDEEWRLRLHDKGSVQPSEQSGQHSLTPAAVRLRVILR